jgi:hypothetical protein
MSTFFRAKRRENGRFLSQFGKNFTGESRLGDFGCLAINRPAYQLKFTKIR